MYLLQSLLFPINRVPQRVGEKLTAKAQTNIVAVSNQSRPLASRRRLALVSSLTILPLFVSNQSRPLASRRAITTASFIALILCFQSIASPSEQEKSKIQRMAQVYYHRFQSIASPSEQENEAISMMLSGILGFPINRVPQRVGDRLVCRRGCHHTCFQSIASPSEQEKERCM